MAPALDVRPPSSGLARRLRQSRMLLAIVAVVVAGAALIGVDRVVFDDPTFIERVSIDNPSGYNIRLAVAGDESGSMPLGVAVQHCVTTFELVIDQGDMWRIIFATQGRDGGEVRVTRDTLAGNGWTFRVPDSVVAQFQRVGAPLPPPQSCSPGP